MKLQAGKSYMCRDGLIETLEQSKFIADALQGKYFGYHYVSEDVEDTQNGNLIFGGTIAHGKDIIGEHLD